MPNFLWFPTSYFIVQSFHICDSDVLFNMRWEMCVHQLICEMAPQAVVNYKHTPIFGCKKKVNEGRGDRIQIEAHPPHEPLCIQGFLLVLKQISTDNYT